MSAMRERERPHKRPAPYEGVYKVSESFHSIAAAWESISAGTWSTAAVQSFAALARRVALDLSTFGCGALDQAVVELVLALDALTLSDSVSEAQLARVDYALAGIRAVTVQRLLAFELDTLAWPGEEAPARLGESCARCATGSACRIRRAQLLERAVQAG